MSLSRGKYGLEWNPRQDERKSSGLGWVFVLVGLVALVSFSVTLVRRWRAAAADDALARAAQDEMPMSATATAASTASASAPTATPASSETPPAASTATATPTDSSPAPSVEVPASVRRAVTENRPVRVRNLLLRLEEAERRRDVEMAVSTIEQIRALPGSPAADLDDALARRLGVLNMKRLFERKTPLWVRQVEVRRGDSASRLAAEHGSTFASLKRLNGGDVETIRVGQKLAVMDHPRFTLVVHRRARTADLLLKEKFFKRYDLRDEPTGAAGAYELPKGAAAFWRSLGVSFKTPDQTELDLLMPIGSSVLVSEM